MPAFVIRAVLLKASGPSKRLMLGAVAVLARCPLSMMRVLKWSGQLAGELQRRQEPLDVLASHFDQLVQIVIAELLPRLRYHRQGWTLVRVE